jgi:hypothetical protein
MRQLMQRKISGPESQHFPARAPARNIVLGNQARLRQIAAPRIQPKLEIGAVNDPLEQAADAAADRVMRMPTAPTQINRKHNESGGDDKLHLKSAANSPAPAFAPHSVDAVLSTQGKPLDRASRDYFEPRFGENFSAVRVHDNALAATSAASIGARAYTAGQNIAFAAGQHAPHTPAGKHLLAHELAHVVQQSTAIRRAPPDPAATPAAPPPAAAHAAAPPVASDPLVQKAIAGTATEAEKAILRDKMKNNQISAADLQLMQDYVKSKFADAFRAYLAPQIAGLGAASGNGGSGISGSLQIGGGTVTLGGPGVDTSGPYHTYLKTSLRLTLSGLVKTAGEGFEGSVDTMIEVRSDDGADTATLTLSPPGGDTALAKNIVAKAFPKGPLTMKISADILKWIRQGNIKGNIVIRVTGPGGPSSAGGITVHLDQLPSDVVLDLSISQSSDKPMLAPSTGSPALPGPRAFGTVGAGSAGGKPIGAATAGFDLPLATDTANPLLYGGVGLRATGDTQGAVTGTGGLITGFHLSPITLQLAFTAGIGRSPLDGKAAFAYGAEGSVSYKILQHMEIMALTSVIGGTKDLPPATTAQAGIGGTF